MDVIEGLFQSLKILIECLMDLLNELWCSLLIEGNFLTLIIVEVYYYIEELFFLGFNCFDHALICYLKFIDLLVAHISQLSICVIHHRLRPLSILYQSLILTFYVCEIRSHPVVVQPALLNEVAIARVSKYASWTEEGLVCLAEILHFLIWMSNTISSLGMSWSIYRCIVWFLIGLVSVMASSLIGILSLVLVVRTVGSQRLLLLLFADILVVVCIILR